MEDLIRHGRQIGMAIIAVGLVVLLASALAEPLGWGSPGGKFGGKQIAGCAVGAAIMVAGVLLFLRAKAETGGTGERPTKPAGAEPE